MILCVKLSTVKEKNISYINIRFLISLFFKFISRSCRDKLILNNAIREVFANRFAHLFLSYEHFVILPQSSSSAYKDISGKGIAPSEVLNLTPQQQDTVANFDKISFLSDQVNTT